jgi:hypothetical protein
MTYVEFLNEASRRDFLKKMIVGVAGSMMPGASVPSVVKQAASATRRFKILYVAQSRGEWEPGGVVDVVASSVRDAVDSVLDDFKEQERANWDDYDDDEFESSEFIGEGHINELKGLGSASIGEEDGFYVIRDDNPFYKLLNRVEQGWRDLSSENLDALENGLQEWEFEEWDKVKDQYSDEHQDNDLNNKHQDHLDIVTITLPIYVAQALYNALNK